MDGVISCPLLPNELEIPDVSFGTLLFDGIRKHTAPALVDVSTGNEVSRQYFGQKSESIARNLVLRGCRRGDVVAIFAHNSVEWMLCASAIFRVEATLAGISSLLTSGELLHQLNICRPKFLFTEESLLTVLNEVIDKIDYGSSLQVIVKGTTQDYISLDSLLSDPPSHVVLPTLRDYRPTPDDGFLILFSSGTTGLPKAVLLSHRSFILQCLVQIHPLIKMLNKCAIVCTPMCHLTGIMSALVALLNGNTAYVMLRFDFETYLKMLVKNQITEIVLVPPIATLFVKSALVDTYQVQLAEIVCGAAPLSPELEHLLRLKFPTIKIRQVYGMTEACGAFIAVPTNADTNLKPGSIGVPVFNCKIKIIDIETGKTLGRNETGEICVKSPLNMIGYVNNSEATMNTVDQEGWLHTGDFGYYDADGYFFITDRIKELIKYKAYQVAPAELEAVLLTHPEVADAAVVGLPDFAAGELPMAWVVRQPWSKISESELQRFVQGKVAAYKELRGGVRFVAAIPKNASGKILRRVIRSGLLDGKL